MFSKDDPSFLMMTTLLKSLNTLLEDGKLKMSECLTDLLKLNFFEQELYFTEVFVSENSFSRIDNGTIVQ